MAAKSQPSHFNAESDDIGVTKIHSRRMLSQWLETNATFNIRGKTLKGWIKEENSNLAPVLRAFDSILAIPLMILLILLIWAPSLIITIVLSTRDRYVFDDGLPASLFIAIGFAVVGLLATVIGSFLFSSYRQERKESKHTWDDWTHLVSPGKKMIVADKGFLGMVDDRAMEGDMLFNLVGCPESVVLRKVEGGRKRYVLVGTCYLHLTPTDAHEYFGPMRDGWTTSQQQEEARAKWMDGPKKWKLEEIELV